MEASVPPTQFSADAVVIESPADVSPVTLFADERARLRQAIAAALRKRGHVIASVEEVERIEAAAARGELVLEGGQRCRAPLSHAEVEHRYFRKHTIARATAECGPDCRLRVTLEAPQGSEVDDKYWRSALVRRAENPRAWMAAPAALGEVDETFGGMRGFGTGGADVTFLAPETIGRWKGQVDTRQFDAREPELATCSDPNPFAFALHFVRAAVRADGSIARCEAQLDRLPSSDGPDIARCICDVVDKINLGRGDAQRRLRVLVADNETPRAASMRAKLSTLQAGTEDWTRRLTDSPALDRCLANAPPSAAFSATVGLPVAADGSIEDIVVLGEIHGVDTMRFVDCLVKELALVPLPCRPPGITELRLRLDVGQAP